jgi:hypothetical protein
MRGAIRSNDVVFGTRIILGVCSSHMFSGRSDARKLPPTNNVSMRVVFASHHNFGSAG